MQVIDESNNEIVYTMRVKGTSFRPKVFKKGIYSIRIGDPDKGEMKTLTGIKSLSEEKLEKLVIKF